MTHIKPFIFSAIVLTAILWLTLSPDPLPDNDLPLFEGMDKIVHACMFGGLYFALRFDLTLWTRRHGNTHPNAPIPPHQPSPSRPSRPSLPLSTISPLSAIHPSPRRSHCHHRHPHNRGRRD